MFTLLDLIAPIGVCSVAFILCLLAVIKAKELPPRIISIVVGLFFLSGIPLFYWMRSGSLKADYVTEHGMKVVKGKQNDCTQLLVQVWEKDLLDFWQSKHPDKNVMEALKDKYLICMDVEKIELSTTERFYRGYAYKKTAVIGYRPNDVAYVKSLYRHEVSHLIAGYLGYPWNDKTQNELFAKLGLGD